MPVTLHEDSFDMTLDVLETVPISPQGPLPSCYPLPELAPTGRQSRRQLRTLVLQNELIGLTICPDLGGRIIRIQDKRTGRELIPLASERKVSDGGVRGPRLSWGLAFLCGPEGAQDRLNGMGKVDALVKEPEDEESPGAVLIHEVCPGMAASFQAAITLRPGSAEVLLEMKAFNRSLRPLALQAGVWMEGEGWEAWPSSGGYALASPRSFWWAGPLELWRVEAGPEGASFLPHPSQSPLLPRETASWSLRLAPFTEIGAPLGSSYAVGAGLKEGSLLVQATSRRLDARVTLHTDQGEFAALSDLHPESLFSVELSDLPPLQALQVDEVLVPLDQDRPPLPSPRVPSAVRSALSFPADGSPEDLFFKAAASGDWPGEAPLAGMDHARLVLTAQKLMGEKKWLEADQALEQALLTNGEDVLAWWAKGWAKRRAGVDDERPEILNAHFLSPLEPILRAESFLQQGALQGKEPNPVVAPLAKNPDAALEVVHLILEAGRVDEATLLMDELLRHEETPLIRLLMAWLLATQSRMKAEAAQHIRAIEGRGLTPPFPWRRLEIQAALETAQEFPQSKPLQDLASLARLAAAKNHRPGG